MKYLIVKDYEGNIRFIIKKSEIISYHIDLRDREFYRRFWINLKKEDLQYDILFTKDTIQKAIKNIYKVKEIKETAKWEDFINYEIQKETKKN